MFVKNYWVRHRKSSFNVLNFRALEGKATTEKGKGAKENLDVFLFSADFQMLWTL